MENWDKFKNKYKPLKNNICPTKNYDGYLFDITSTEYRAVSLQKKTQVWTLVEYEGKMLLESGLHFVNRLGFFICKVPWKRETEITLNN